MKGLQRILFLWVSATLAACSGGGGSAVPATGAGAASVSCTGSCASASTYLTTADVGQVIAQAVAEAQARNVNATVGVVDRVGNVLAVYRMGAAATRSTQIASLLDAAGNPLVHTGLEGIRLPASGGPLQGLNLDQLAVIAKAITGAYLSSEGNAFSTRTAGQIVQQHFNPGTLGAPSGPLFGVQFSQLACSDLVNRSPGAPTVGPQRSPLGLSADPGGFPLYKSGTVVGGVGVLADGEYSVDTLFDDHGVNLDEAIAMAATYGYGVPANRRADEITVGGITLEYTNTEYAGLMSAPGEAPAFASISPGVGKLVPVLGYADGQIHAGTAFGEAASGVVSDGGVNFPGQDAFVLVDSSGNRRFPLRGGTDGAAALKESEVLEILRAALAIAEKARGQIRLPLGSSARVSITVVDSLGTPLGFVRSRDAPLFGADVALQKARTVALFSSSTAASFIAALPQAQYIAVTNTGLTSTGQVTLGDYVSAAQTFLGDSTAFADGAIAYSVRAVGNLSRPFFPDGIDGTPNGPFSKPIAGWSVFSTGLELDLSINAILQDVVYAAQPPPGLPGITDVPEGCAGVGFDPPAITFTKTAAPPRAANGLQIFPGSVPIYRGATLVGAIGVSGDGVDQDDMVAFLGLHNASTALNGSINQAPASRRADVLVPEGTRLLYVQCPQSPFLNSDLENVCAGL